MLKYATRLQTQLLHPDSHREFAAVSQKSELILELRREFSKHCAVRALHCLRELTVGAVHFRHSLSILNFCVTILPLTAVEKTTEISMNASAISSSKKIGKKETFLT